MTAENVIKFPTRRRKAFRCDWMELPRLPQNCLEFKGRWVSLYRNGKMRQFNYRAQLATLDPNDDELWRACLIGMIETRSKALRQFGLTP